MSQDHIHLNRARADVERKIRSRPQILGARTLVTTVGRDEEVIRAYIRNQELADQQLDQLELKISAAPESNQPSQHPLKPPLAVPNQTSSFAGGYWLAPIEGPEECRQVSPYGLPP
jgi:hypothetical protein